MQKGFIALPIVALIILGMTVLAGGGYAVYKINKLETESNQKVSELEGKLNQVATTTDQKAIAVTAASTTEPTKEQAAVKTATSISQVTLPVTETTATQKDFCSNLSGVQTSIPYGFKASGDFCTQMEDKCSNIEGFQESIPSGMLIFNNNACMTESDMDKINKVEYEANSDQREAEQLAEQCAEIKKEVYEMDKEILDIQTMYQEKIAKIYTDGTMTKNQGASYTNTLNQQMSVEMAPIELERNKLANEYNYTCI
jgi:outer membrane murein-binding lipoprotein Lpp